MQITRSVPFLRLTIFAASIFICLTHPIWVFSQTIDNLTITKSWIRATPAAAKVAGGYLTIANNGSNDDVLIAVNFAGAEKSQIHEMSFDNDVMTMRPLTDGANISAGSTLVLKPGGIHLMLMGIKNQLKDGQNFPVELTFAKAGTLKVDFQVLTTSNAKKMMMQEN